MTLVLALLRRREVAFLLVGGTNTLLGLAAFTALYYLWGDTLHYLGSLVLAYAVGIIVGFVLHRRFVFRVEGNVLVDLLRFTSVQVTSLALNAALLPLMVEVVHLPVVPAQVVSLALVVVASYFGHLLFSFRRPADHAER
ncbi:GtrA family protein [Nocardioides sp. DS6]|uniref:GtrA family protein n=1 Tax=Nocardioides eburneus TaxID=3231482 RepID=A0ABV3T3B3_9ACTN